MPETPDDKNAFFANARTDGIGPLDGVRVLEVGTTWAAPRCCQIFADYGADVIKIELRRAPDVTRGLPPTMPGTDPPDGYLNATANRNKRNITLDLQQEEGRDLFLKLAANADIVVQNLKKGTLAGWGCGYEDVRAVNEDVVFVSITAFGQYGPYSHRPGYDPLAQAVSGFMHMNGTEGEDTPAKAPMFMADELAGLHAVMSGLAALHHRNATGEGQHVDISLVDAIIDSCTGIHTIAAQGLPTPRMGNGFSFSVPSSAYHCKDGWVYAGVLLDAHWRVLCNILGRPELATDPGYATIVSRIPRREELDAFLGEWCAERTREEVVAAFEEGGIPAAPILKPHETVNDPHVQAREAIQTVETPEGVKQNIPGPSARFSRTPVRIRHTARTLGTDTADVLQEIGIDEARFNELKDRGIV